MLYDQDTQGRALEEVFYPKTLSMGWEQATWQGPAEVLSKDERGRRECWATAWGRVSRQGSGQGHGYRGPKQRHSPWSRMEVP